MTLIPELNAPLLTGRGEFESGFLAKILNYNRFVRKQGVTGLRIWLASNTGRLVSHPKATLTSSAWPSGRSSATPANSTSRDFRYYGHRLFQQRG